MKMGGIKVATRLDLQTLKTLIVELRDVENLSFQDISYRLKDEYGVDKSRQAISGLYNRFKKQAQINDQNQRLITDIVNLYCIMESATVVYEKLLEVGINITYRQVLNTLKENDEYITSVRQTIVANIESKLDSATNVKELETGMDYKGVPISKKRLNEYIELACIVHTRTSITKQLMSYYKLSGNKDIIKNVGDTFGVSIKNSDLRQIF